MFWEHSHIQQLMRMVTPDAQRRRPDRTGSARDGGDRFGLCPRCQAFVRIGPSGCSDDQSTCPSCRKPIDELKSLWS